MDIIDVIKNMVLIAIASCYMGGMALYVRNRNYQYKKDKKMTISLILLNIFGYLSFYPAIAIFGKILHIWIENEKVLLVFIGLIIFLVCGLGIITRFKKK